MFPRPKPVPGIIRISPETPDAGSAEPERITTCPEFPCVDEPVLMFTAPEDVFTPEVEPVRIFVVPVTPLVEAPEDRVTEPVPESDCPERTVTEPELADPETSPEERRTTPEARVVLPEPKVQNPELFPEPERTVTPPETFPEAVPLAILIEPDNPVVDGPVEKKREPVAAEFVAAVVS